MKADSGIKKEMMMSIRKKIETGIADINDQVKNSIRAGYADELMTAKRQIMEIIIDGMPLGADQCYFCRKKGRAPCERTCEYAQHHGVCDSSGSDYQKIVSERRCVQVALSAYHPIGMKYRSFLIKRTRVDCDVLHRMYIPNLTFWRDGYVKKLRRDLDAMDGTETVEALMAAKAKLLYDMIRLPTSGDMCYFCLLHPVLLHHGCSLCQYAHKHKTCRRSSSDWAQLQRAEADLVSSIRDRYYRAGETYKTPEEEAREKYLKERYDGAVDRVIVIYEEDGKPVYGWYGNVPEE